MKPTRLQDLAALRDALARADAERRAAAARAAEARQAERAQRELFARSIGPVHTLVDRGRAELAAPRPAPLPLQREADERAALREALSDEVDIETLLLTDDGLSFRRAGVGADVVARLRRGHWSIQRQIDLHGLTRDEARSALAEFVRSCQRAGERCVRVVHGKGIGSPGRQPVLKAKVQRWLAQCAEVLAFAQASGPDGGAGALIVLLASRP
ncbi:MAG: Smr/MutS family protein [Rubrivivax sp.]